MASTALKTLSLFCAMGATTALVLTDPPALMEKCKGGVAMTFSDVQMKPSVSAHLGMTDMMNNKVFVTGNTGPKNFCVQRGSNVTVNMLQTRESHRPVITPENQKRVNREHGVYKDNMEKDYRIKVEGSGALHGFGTLKGKKMPIPLGMVRAKIAADCQVCGPPCSVCFKVKAMPKLSTCKDVEMPPCHTEYLDEDMAAGFPNDAHSFGTITFPLDKATLNVLSNTIGFSGGAYASADVKVSVTSPDSEEVSYTGLIELALDPNQKLTE